MALYFNSLQKNSNLPPQEGDYLKASFRTEVLVPFSHAHGNYPCQAGQQSYRDRNLITNLQGQFYLNPLSVSIGRSDNPVEKTHSQKGGFLKYIKVCGLCT